MSELILLTTDEIKTRLASHLAFNQELNRIIRNGSWPSLLLSFLRDCDQ